MVLAETKEFSFFGAKLAWHDKSLLQLKYHFRQLASRSRGISIGKTLKELTVFLRGWINCFGIVQGYKNVLIWTIGYGRD
ncbi:hypothetical protein [Microbulbifer sp. JMSA003]|uniref:hypothetical protein n=1 Tax=Microbulbifer sp. JMSA003 TaxID=3243369 RepID=UPI004039F066